MNEDINRYRTLDSLEIKSFFNNKIFLLSEVKPLSNKKILELGCGFGNIIKELAEKNNIKNAFAIDKFPFGEDPLIKYQENEEIKKLRIKEVEIFQKRINYKEMDALNLTEKTFNTKFNFIYSFRMFMYIKLKDRYNLILNIYNNLLEDNGIALLEISSDKNGLGSDDKYLINKLKEYNDESFKFEIKTYSKRNKTQILILKIIKGVFLK